MAKRDAKFVPELPWTVDEMFAHLRDNHFTPQALKASKFVHGYSPGSNELLERNAVMTLYRSASSPLSHIDPLTPSIEKPHSWAYVRGLPALHTIGNITMIRYCINILKAELPPHSIPLLKRSFQLHEQARAERPQRGYHTKVKVEYEKIETVSRAKHHT
jgi:hypothetical protein